METVNAKITGTMLGIESHGIMTLYVTIEWPGCGVGVGGYALDSWSEGDGRRIGHAHGIEAVRKILDAVGVEKWEDLRGKYVRAVVGGPGSTCKKIGHITDNKWFDLAEFFGSFK